MAPAQAHVDPPPPTPQQEVEAQPKSRRPWGILGAIIVLVGSSAFITSYLVREAVRPSTNDAYVEGRAIRISPRVSGQVMALKVDDNMIVRAGDVLLEIDPADYLAKRDQARAAVKVAESTVQQAEASVLRADAAVGEAEAALGAAEADSKRRASDYRRYAAMGTDGVSEQQLETARTAMDVGERQSKAAAKKLAAARSEANVARANVISARSHLTDAEAQLHFAELQVQYTRVLGPDDHEAKRGARGVRVHCPTAAGHRARRALDHGELQGGAARAHAGRSTRRDPGR